MAGGRCCAALVFLSGALAPAYAACPIELAVYSDHEKAAEIDFTPTMASAMATNSFRMILDNDDVLDGTVTWSEGTNRPNGALMYNCPDGGVAGAELAACTLWEGVIYTVDETGAVGLLPGQGKPAPKTLVLTNLGPSLRQSKAYGPNGFSTLPWDAFSLSGCQE